MAGACGLLGQKRTAEIRQLVFQRALLLFVRVAFHDPQRDFHSSSNHRLLGPHLDLLF
jgi:hypothetical protein